MRKGATIEEEVEVRGSKDLGLGSPVCLRRISEGNVNQGLLRLAWGPLLGSECQ